MESVPLVKQVHRTLQTAIMMTPIHQSNHIVDLYYPYTLLNSHTNPFRVRTIIGRIELRVQKSNNCFTAGIRRSSSQ
jgi:hypothetical protein